MCHSTANIRKCEQLFKISICNHFHPKKQQIQAEYNVPSNLNYGKVIHHNEMEIEIAVTCNLGL